MLPDDAEGGRHQKDPGDKGGGADDQGGDIDEGKPAAGGGGLTAHRGVEGVNVLLGGGAPGGHVAVGHVVGLLGLAVGAGADQINQGVLEAVVTAQQGAVDLLVRPGGEGGVVAQLLVQSGLLRLDLLDQPDHGGMVSCHDVGQGQAVNVHQGAPDLLQLPLADHVLVYNGARVGMDVVDAEHRQDIGQKRHQSKQDNGYDQALLKG